MQIPSFLRHILQSSVVPIFFRLYLINGTMFEKKKKVLSVVRLAVPYFSTLSHKRSDFTKKKCKNLCFDLLFNFVGNISHSKQNSARFTVNLHRASFNVPVILVSFYWNWNFLGIFSKNPYIKCNEDTPSGSRVVPCGRADRHDEDTNRFSQFCERA
jgi:hypothetical protein